MQQSYIMCILDLSQLFWCTAQFEIIEVGAVGGEQQHNEIQGSVEVCVMFVVSHPSLFEEESSATL